MNRVQRQKCLTYTTPNPDPNKPGDGMSPVGPGWPLPGWRKSTFVPRGWENSHKTNESFKEGLGNPLEVKKHPLKSYHPKRKKKSSKYPFSGAILKLGGYTSWWLNQPIWKICSSNWIMPPGRDENWKYLSCQHLRIGCIFQRIRPLASAMVRPRLPMTRAICAFGTSTISWWSGG